MHEPRLLDALSRRSTFKFDGVVHRATPLSVPPLTPSTAGGRWSPRGSVPVLYTSLSRDGALAEISYHWSLLDPLPTKNVAVHQLRVTSGKTLRLVMTDLTELGISESQLHELAYSPTQAIGAAVAFLGCSGLIVPSARWDIENIVLFAENDTMEFGLEVLKTEQVPWQNWARANGLLEI